MTVTEEEMEGENEVRGRGLRDKVSGRVTLE